MCQALYWLLVWCRSTIIAHNRPWGRGDGKMGGRDGAQETSYDAVVAKWAGTTWQLPVWHRKDWEQEMTKAVWVRSIWLLCELSVNTVTDHRTSNLLKLITRLKLRTVHRTNRCLWKFLAMFGNAFIKCDWLRMWIILSLNQGTVIYSWLLNRFTLVWGLLRSRKYQILVLK